MFSATELGAAQTVCMYAPSDTGRASMCHQHPPACSLGEREERGRELAQTDLHFFMTAVAREVGDCFLKKTANFFFYLKKIY